MNYWDDCIREAFEDAKIAATEEQIDAVVSWIEDAHENYDIEVGDKYTPCYIMIPGE